MADSSNHHICKSTNLLEAAKTYVSPPNAVQPGSYTVIPQRRTYNQTQSHRLLRPAYPPAVYKILKQLR